MLQDASFNEKDNSKLNSPEEIVLM